MFLYSIKRKSFFLIFSILLSIGLSMIIAYFYSISLLKEGLATSLSSSNSLLTRSIEYNYSKNKNILNEKSYINLLKSLLISKSGYIYIIDKDFNLLYHPTKKGKLETDYTNEIISNKGSGILEYTSKTSFQEKIISYNYSRVLDAWIIPGINKKDYFEKIKQEYLLTFSIIFALLSFLLIFITLLIFKKIRF
jgi:methyl-accepting chemotaxis protein